MAHYVKCKYCGSTLNRDKEECVKISNRYAHKACAVAQENTNKQEFLDKKVLEKYIMELLGENFINSKVQKQLKDYVTKYNYTYSGMHKALVYFYEVKGNDKSKANNGIGIIPWVYQDAYRYYYSIWEAQQKNKDKNIETYRPTVIEVRIKRPERKLRKRNLFSFLEDDI